MFFLEDGDFDNIGQVKDLKDMAVWNVVAMEKFGFRLIEFITLRKVKSQYEQVGAIQCGPGLSVKAPEEAEAEVTINAHARMIIESRKLLEQARIDDEF